RPCPYTTLFRSKSPFEDRQLAIVAFLDALGRKRERLRVLRESFCGAAVKVPRHLVEQQNQRKPSSSGIGPGVELAARGEPRRLAEAGGDLGIQGRIGEEPATELLLELLSAARLRLEPEAEQGLDSFVHRRSSAYLTLCRRQRQEPRGAQRRQTPPRSGPTIDGAGGRISATTVRACFIAGAADDEKRRFESARCAFGGRGPGAREPARGLRGRAPDDRCAARRPRRARAPRRLGGRAALPDRAARGESERCPGLDSAPFVHGAARRRRRDERPGARAARPRAGRG